MPQLRLTVRSITPLLMYGAANKDDSAKNKDGQRLNDSLRAEPELRASSIRGLLRYWLRAVLGSRLTMSSEVYQKESAFLGSTELGSRVRVRVQPVDIDTAENQRVMPRRFLHKAFEPRGKFRITLSTHPLDQSGVLEAESDLVKALFLMLHFSGLGRRSRRGSGNLQVLETKGYEATPSLAVVHQDRKALVEYLAAISRSVSPAANTTQRHPSFPVFAWNTAVVLVGQETHGSYKDAFEELWSVSGPYHQEGGIFGSVRPRRASAVHMRVAAVSDGYIAQQTILCSGHGQWGTMQKYIQSCLAQGFEAIYGTWEHWQ